MKWNAEITLTENIDHKTVDVLIQVKNEHGESLFTHHIITHDAYLCFHRGWHWTRNMINMYCQHAAMAFNVSLRLSHPVTDITATTAILHPSIFETHRFDGIKNPLNPRNND